MLNKEEFIKFIIDGPAKGSRTTGAAKQDEKESALPEGLEGFGFDDEEESGEENRAGETSFARQLVEASGFGAAQYLATAEVILGTEAASQHLPDKVYYWPKAAKRPYQTLLFELTLSSDELLKVPLFRPAKGVLEDALSRLVQETLRGFQVGGENRRADVKQGKQEETLCIVSIRDLRDRDHDGSHLVCLGTVARGEGSLETFHIREAARFWEPQLARDHLERLYDRHFKKLASEKWQDAFITGDERKLARKLMDVCQVKKPDEAKIQEAVVDLLEEIALSYGLRKKPGGGRRLEATDLPQNHDIGIPAAVMGGKKNPFKGMSLRDEKNRLLGYIIYCLDQKKDAELLKKHLSANNRFHNVLVVYPNGESTGLELWQGNRPLEGKLTKRGATFEGEGQVVNLLSRFFVVSKALVSDPRQLAEELAYRARYLRGFALRELEKPASQQDKDLAKLFLSFQEVFLNGDGTDETKQHDRFADSYAQTLTYGLLSARWISKDDLRERGERFTLENATDLLERTSPFFKELFTQVISRSHDASRDWLLQDISDLLDRIDIDAVFEEVKEDVLLGHDPVMHFYEPFLEAYDPEEKIRCGVFYTPYPIVSYIVGSVHSFLQTQFGLEDGLADTTTWGDMVAKHKNLKLPPLSDEKGEKKTISPDAPFVQILDPATGTATFLVEIIDVIYRRLTEKWKAKGYSGDRRRKEWNDYVPKHLLPRIYGYELMMAPYAIAHLKIALKISELGFDRWDRLKANERVNVYLTDSLEPHRDFSERLAFDVPALAHESNAVNRVKSQAHFTVVVGNPPYLREKQRGTGSKGKRIGGWIRHGSPEDGKQPLFDDFLKELTRTNQGVHAKLAYELSVMFWRLAIWLVLERTSRSGIIGMISPRAYLGGPGHAGMREWIRTHSSDVWITDLGGDNRGARKSENVFDIETGVTIGICSQTPGERTPLCCVRYRELRGTADQKLAALRAAGIGDNLGWKDCPHEAGLFLPANSGTYNEWPALTDLFPWQHSGCQFKRLWPIAESPDLLRARWKHLLSLPVAKRGEAFVETDARVVASNNSAKSTLRCTGIAKLTAGAPVPNTQKYTYRSLDRQWAFVDERFADRLRPTLAATVGPRQVFATTLMSKQLGDGPAICFTASLPDMDVFCNRGAKDIIPLWRDPSATQPNVTSGVIDKISSFLGLKVQEEDLLCYCAAVLGSPHYAEMFEEELTIPGPRIPISKDRLLFKEGVNLGAQFIWLQTYGERWLLSTKNPNKQLSGKARVAEAIPEVEAGYPEDFEYDATTQTLRVGKGSISNVSAEVYGYSQSGFRPVDSWLRYRMKSRGGRAGRSTTRSELDTIRPERWTFTNELLELLWVVEGCVGLWAPMGGLLEAVVSGDQIPAADLPQPSGGEKKEPRISAPNSQASLL